MANLVEAPGAERLARTMGNATHELGDMGTPTRAAAADIANAARGRVPVVTGYLRSTIEASSTGDSATVSVSAVYGSVIHWGAPSRNIRANPFLTNAVSETERAWSAEYVQELDRIVDIVEAD